MTRSKLTAVAAALSLALAACATDGSPDGADTDTESAQATETTGELTGTVTDAEVAEDGTTTLTVETDDGTEELLAARSAHITTRSEAGGLQRTRLSTWLQSNEFDGETEYTLQRYAGEVTDVRE